jgi:Kelch motif/Galactose oxidase, central domain
MLAIDWPLADPMEDCGRLETMIRPGIAGSRRLRGGAATLAILCVACAVAACSGAGATSSLTRGSSPRSTGSTFGLTDTPVPTETSSPSETPVSPFTQTGQLGVARYGHTATLLKDGRVLIVGGVSPTSSTALVPSDGGVSTVIYQSLASAELYDPATGEFSFTGSMSVGRVGHTATLLPDGRVLIAGGSSQYVPTRLTFEYLATAELYDPVTGTFSMTGSMAVVRGGHSATLLPGGRVLIAGGDGGGSEWSVASAELYDPTSGTFSQTGSMTVARVRQPATLLTDGRVLIAGGMVDARGVSAPELASAELYNPKTGKFTSTGSMADSRMAPTATLLADGRVLLAGGWGGLGEVLSSAELYDPKTGAFTSTGSMAPKADYTATLLPSGLVLVVGGGNAAQTYDPGTGVFTQVPGVSDLARGGSANVPLSGTATLLSDGRVLFVGGGDGNNVFASAELHQP